MAIIPDDMRFIGISPTVDLKEKKSAQINKQTEPYTMSDIVETVSGEITTDVDWGDIEGTLSDQIDLQSALDEKQDSLVSGTNIKTINGNNVLGSGNLQITTTDQWGDITGTLSNQTDLQSELDDKQDTLVSGTSIKTVNGTTLLGSGDVETASVNPSSTFLPINESDAFADSPIFAQHSFGSQGFTLLETKVNGLDFLPEGGIEASPSWGISAELNSVSGIERVQLGDFDDYTFSGKFEWSTGGNAPADASYIKFDTYGYDLFESTVLLAKLDANGFSDNVSGLLYDGNAGIIGLGDGLDATTRSSSQQSIIWDLFGGDFTIKGFGGNVILFSNNSFSQTYIQDFSSKLGLEAQAMYISDDLVLTASPTTSTKVLNVRDASGNSYQIKLYVP